MKYECSYYPNLNTIEVSTHGVANITALIEMLHRIAELCGQEKSANILVDHSALDASSLTMNNIDTLSRITASLKDTFKKRKCAHVVAEDLQFGLVRAWEIMVEIKGFTDMKKRLFKNRDEAIEWVKAGP
jgi:hypothetical protein